MSESMTGSGNLMYGKKHSDERKQQSSHKGNNHPLFGKPRSAETKKKISEKNKGCTGLIREANGMFGKQHNNSTKEKISKNNPWTGSAGKGIHPNIGRKMSDEQKEHLRKMFTGVKLNADRIQKLKIPKGPQKIVSCPHCNKSGGVSNMQRYHFENCKEKL